MYISTIPSDYFIGGTATPAAFKGIYVPNLLAYTTELAVSNVPVPSAIWFLGTGLLGLIGLNQKKPIAGKFKSDQFKFLSGTLCIIKLIS